MASALNDILGYVPLTGLIKKVDTGLRRVLPDAFWSLTSNRAKLDLGRYTVVRGTRQTARRVDYSSPSLKREQRASGRPDVKLITTFEHVDQQRLLGHRSTFMSGDRMRGGRVSPSGFTVSKNRSTK